jgi:hypothetical protein
MERVRWTDERLDERMAAIGGLGVFAAAQF